MVCVRRTVPRHGSTNRKPFVAQTNFPKVSTFREVYSIKKKAIKVPKSETFIYICKMKRIIAKRTLREFWEIHSDAEQYLKTWYDTAMNSNWLTPNDVKKSYVNASIISNNRVVFNIKGNTYRLVVQFNYPHQWAFIRFIGTHAEYDRIDSTTI